MLVWLHTLLPHSCVAMKDCLRVSTGGECCDEFVEEASVGSVDGVEERGGLSVREWRALEEFGDENGVVV